MSPNHKRLLVLVLWAQVVLVLAYWKWWPRPLGREDLGRDERAFILRLPEDGILTRMIDRGVMVSLAVPEPPRPPAAQAPVKKPVSEAPPRPTVLENKDKLPEPAAPVVPAVPSTSVVEHAKVLDKICKVEIQSTTRLAVCYAVIAVPTDRMAALTSAGDNVSVWVEGK